MAEHGRRRTDRKRETRLALLAAALAEFGEHGLDAPSLDAICARAGYTRGAFYVHFRDRADLVVAVVEYAISTFIDAVIASGDEAHDLERTVARFAEAMVRSTGGTPRPRLHAARARGGSAPALPLPAGVPFARLLEGVTRDARLRASFTSLLVGAMARLRAVTVRAQEARSARRDIDAGHVGTLLVLLALGMLVARDFDITLQPARLRATVLRLLGTGAAGDRRARTRRRRTRRG